MGTEPNWDTRTAGAKSVERYRTLVQTAPPELLAQAYAEALEGVPESQRSQLPRLFGAEPRWNTAEAAPRLAQRLANQEQRQPGYLEAWLRDSSDTGRLAQTLITGLLGSVAARGYVDDAPREPLRASEHDIAEEYGRGVEDEGVVGGAGFEHDKYDFTV